MTASSFRSSGFYIVALVGWVAMTLLAIYIAGNAAIKDTEHDFRGHASEITTELRQKLHANEAVISAFAAFLSAVEGGDREAAVRFSRSMLGAYPHIYMLEVARRVRAQDARNFERQMRDSWQGNFHIRTFNYGGDRQWSEAGHRSEHWPIVFLYPDFPEARPVLGLDLASVPHLAKSLELAQRGPLTVSSPPFRLVEGDLAYILFQTVDRPLRRGVVQAFTGEMVALLVVKADSMSPRWVPDGMEVRADVTSPAGGDSAVIFERKAVSGHWSETMLLPRLRVEAEGGSTSQAVRLGFEQQVRWRDISGIGLRSVAILSLLSLALVILYLRRHHIEMTRANEEHARAEFLATHDPLTGLPNRLLFADRARQALLRHERHGSMFALFMIDLDHFKDVNDVFGHERGDFVLVEVARRIGATLRGTDTVARFGGDEFLVLVADVEGETDAMSVARKILDTVARPIETPTESIDVTCSMGIALCPRDGTEVDDLLRQADHAMYRIKSGGRNGVSAAAEPPKTADRP
jgi:diguanylate cyclase (GGDEF)-like protein